MEGNRNTQPDFVGLEELKQKHAKQVEMFERWASERNWMGFHDSHYDWWAFPIDKPSRLGYAYTLFKQEVGSLKRDPDFMKKYLRGVELLMLSWGWDLQAEQEIVAPDPDQKWNDWPIRLSKCAQSLELFDCPNELVSVKKYGQLLLQRGADFTFRGTDLSSHFQNNQ